MVVAWSPRCSMRSLASVLLPVPPGPWYTYAHSGWLRRNGAASERCRLRVLSVSWPVHWSRIHPASFASVAACSHVHPVSTV